MGRFTLCNIISHAAIASFFTARIVAVTCFVVAHQSRAVVVQNITTQNAVLFIDEKIPTAKYAIQENQSVLRILAK